jgi:integrase
MTRGRRASFGTVRQLPSGRWQARYSDGGVRHTLDDAFGSERDARRALARVETDLGRGVHVKPSVETLSTFAGRYLAEKTDWSPTTREDREGLWHRHVEPAFGSKALKDLTTTAIKAWHARLARKHPSTAQGAYRLLRQILNAAVDEGLLVVNPCRVRGAGVDRAPERQTASVAELEAIVAVMPERLRALVLLASWCGLRRSELLGLRRRDVDVEGHTVTVSRSLHHLRGGRGVVISGPKTRAGSRSVVYPWTIADDLADHLERFVGPSRDALVFVGEKGGPLRPHVLGAAFRAARRTIGRDDLTLHDLRHSANTMAAVTGATLPELMHRMGHATPHSAMRYLHATRDRDRVIADALAELRPVAPVVDITSKTHHAE